jgi:putative membrane protein
MKTRLWIYAAMFAATILWSACDDDEDGRSLNDADETFVEKAALSNMTEIEFGQMAATNGNDQMVRDFGQHMVNAHTTAQNELRNIANDYNDIDWPEELDQQHQQMRQQLMNMTGYSFDSLYMKSQVMDHEATRTVFETEVNGGTEQSVKSYASKYLPHIEEHLQKADSIQNVLLTTGQGD